MSSQNSFVDILIPKDSGILTGRAFENHDSGDLMNSVSAFKRGFREIATPSAI